MSVKLFLPFLAVLLIFSLVSCSRESAPMLDTREKEITLVCTLRIGETENTLKVTLSPMTETTVRTGEIELLSPDELKGVKVQFGEEGTFLCYDDLKIPIPRESFSSGLISSLFSLSDVNITAVRATEDGNTEAEAQNDRGRYIITLDKRTSGMLKASGVFDGEEFSLTAEEYHAS